MKFERAFIVVISSGIFFFSQAEAQHKTINEKYSSPLTAKMKTEWRKKLNANAYQIMVDKGTEQPYQNQYWNNHDKGIYVSAATGEPLFSSDSKFDSHTGWPSFSQALDKTKIEIVEDNSFGELRQEVVEKKTGLHLGHLFLDGPEPTGLRYCMNSGALKLVKVSNKVK